MAESVAAPQSSEQPVVCIRPARGWIAIDFRELWQWRELLYFLTWRDVKVKYKQTLLGFAWAWIVPLVNMVVFGTIFGQVAKLPTDGLNPYLFYLAGLAPWQYFSNAVNMASNSLVGYSHLITKIYFPRLFVPIGICVANLVDYVLAFAILLAMILSFGLLPAPTTLFIPFLMVIAIATALGVGLALSALNVRYRDVKFVVPFIVQIWMYLSVLIPFSRIPERWGMWRYLYGLNPMAGVVEGCRWCLLHHRMVLTRTTETILAGRVVPEMLKRGQEIVVRAVENGSTQVVLRETIQSPAGGPPWGLVAMGLPVVIVFLAFGLYYFKRMEKTFADIV